MTDRSLHSQNGAFNERWLQPGGLVPVDIPTIGILLAEIMRLRERRSGPAGRDTIIEECAEAVEGSLKERQPSAFYADVIRSMKGKAASEAGAGSEK